MSILHHKIVYSLAFIVGVQLLNGVTDSYGGIWETVSGTVRKSPPSAAPTRVQLLPFFTDDQPAEPDSFQLIGNEVSIEAAPSLPEENVPAPASVGSSIPDITPAAAADEKLDFCTSRCSSGHHSWWCRQRQFWDKQSELSRERRLKNSRNLFKKSYYENFPAYHVENYGIYRTCWRKLPEIDCCPEDESKNEFVPSPAKSH
ncbi:MAG: hypothetical protein O2955_04285 [Planctomycetota bacterium]|nr:hypothetical protein [Planctomycetota bacterium]MDA1211708.1 hypothetical protein [Planctomycetota bacterium]